MYVITQSVFPMYVITQSPQSLYEICMLSYILIQLFSSGPNGRGINNNVEVDQEGFETSVPYYLETVDYKVVPNNPIILGSKNTDSGRRGINRIIAVNQEDESKNERKTNSKNIENNSTGRDLAVEDVENQLAMNSDVNIPAVVASEVRVTTFNPPTITMLQQQQARRSSHRG